MLIGDEWRQPPERLDRCLLGGLTPQDWYVEDGVLDAAAHTVEVRPV